MKPIKIGHLTRALRVVFPYMTVDMVRSAVESGTIQAIRNPLVERGDYYFLPVDIKSFIANNRGITREQAEKILEVLGMNVQQQTFLGVA